MTEKKPKKKPEHDDVIPMRDPSRGRDSRGRPMLVFPRSLLINEAPRRSSQPPPAQPPTGA
ncbi:hypothetical protein [Janibacter terrae]|jgi:hypothetical protein|uniref:hypothetical protein n=1 Tax=Janibacter terrae TaxID=103817 RepID=UPI000AC59C4E|nr:hypothetical protein [Janibacter terrae]